MTANWAEGLGSHRCRMALKGTRDRCETQTNVGSRPQDFYWLPQSTGVLREGSQMAGLPSSSFTVINNAVSVLLP